MTFLTATYYISQVSIFLSLSPSNAAPTPLLTADSIAQALAQHLLAALGPDPTLTHVVGDPGLGRASALKGRVGQGVGLVHGRDHPGHSCALRVTEERTEAGEQLAQGKLQRQTNLIGLQHNYLLQHV